MSAISYKWDSRRFRQWLGRIPLPLRREDRPGGYDWSLSIWQMQVSLTPIFDGPSRGREFFEAVIRDNLDLSRPDRVQLVFDRVVTQKTPGEFRRVPDTRDPVGTLRKPSVTAAKTLLQQRAALTKRHRPSPKIQG